MRAALDLSENGGSPLSPKSLAKSKAAGVARNVEAVKAGRVTRDIDYDECLQLDEDIESWGDDIGVDQFDLPVKILLCYIVFANDDLSSFGNVDPTVL